MKTLAFAAMALAVAVTPACKKKDDKAKPAPATPAPSTEPKAAEPVPPPAPAKPLEAVLEARSGSKVAGTVTFTPKGDGVEIVANLTGLTKGDHGFHIHEKGDCSAPDAKSAGGHFNPFSAQHAGPDADAQHAGDLGNLTADDKGVASKTMQWKHVSLTPGKNAIEGRAVVVHEKADDMKSQPSGAAGSRVACGVIKAKAGAAEPAKADDADDPAAK